MGALFNFAVVEKGSGTDLSVGRYRSYKMGVKESHSFLESAGSEVGSDGALHGNRGH